MHRILLAAAAFAALVGTASAQPTARPTYDSRIDEAAARIVAEKIGDIRGGFDFDQVPAFVHAVDWHPAAWASISHPS